MVVSDIIDPQYACIDASQGILLARDHELIAATTLQLQANRASSDCMLRFHIGPPQPATHKVTSLGKGIAMRQRVMDIVFENINFPHQYFMVFSIFQEICKMIESGDDINWCIA